MTKPATGTLLDKVDSIDDLLDDTLETVVPDLPRTDG